MLRVGNRNAEVGKIADGKKSPMCFLRLEIPSGVSSGLHGVRVRSLENSLEANHADDSRSISSADHYSR